MKPLHIVGGGLAGSEAAWQAAQAGTPVILHEMRPVRMTEAHQTTGLAELVCSNSLRSDDWENNAVGLLHEEMRRATAKDSRPPSRPPSSRIPWLPFAAKRSPIRRRTGTMPSSRPGL